MWRDYNELHKEDPRTAKNQTRTKRLARRYCLEANQNRTKHPGDTMTTFKNQCGCIIRTDDENDKVEDIRDRMGDGWEVADDI